MGPVGLPEADMGPIGTVYSVKPARGFLALSWCHGHQAQHHGAAGRRARTTAAGRGKEIRVRERGGWRVQCPCVWSL